MWTSRRSASAASFAFTRYNIGIDGPDSPFSASGKAVRQRQTWTRLRPFDRRGRAGVLQRVFRVVARVSRLTPLLPVARSPVDVQQSTELFLDRPWRDQTLAIRPSGSLSCSMQSSLLVVPSRRSSFFLRSTCFTFSLLCDAMWLRRQTRGT